MKKTILKKFFAVLVCVLLISIPVIYAQQDTAYAEAANQARMDAQRNINPTTWLIIGFFLGIIGYVIAMVSPPKAPAIGLVGKSPDYVAVYVDTYEQVGKAIQMRKAMTGCLINLGCSVVGYGILILAAASVDTY